MEAHAGGALGAVGCSIEVGWVKWSTPDYLRLLERAVHIRSSTNIWGPLKPSRMCSFDVVGMGSRPGRLKLYSFVRNFPGSSILWDRMPGTSHSSSVLLSPTTPTHIGQAHRTRIQSLLSERRKHQQAQF